MAQNYNFTPEQKNFRNPLMAGNILARLDHINTSQEYLIQMLDPGMLANAEMYIAELAAKADKTLENTETPVLPQETPEVSDLYPETAAAAGAAIVPEMLAETGDDIPAPYLSEAETNLIEEVPAVETSQDDYELAA